MNDECGKLIRDTIPEAIGGLSKSSKDIASFAEWCKNASDADQNPAEVFRQIQGKSNGEET
jgi:hypothetical protein